MDLRRYSFFALLGLLLILSTCKKEYTGNGGDSSILLIPDAGDFRLNVLTQMVDGNILLAGTTTRYNSDGIQAGYDTATFYLVDPNTHKVKRINELRKRFGFLHAAIGTPDGGMIVHCENFTRTSSVIVRLDKNYKTLDSIKSDEWQLHYSISNYVNLLTRLKDGNYLLLSGTRNIKKLDAHLKTIWQKNQLSKVSLSYLTETTDSSILASGSNNNLLCLTKYRADGTLNFAKTDSTNSIVEKKNFFWDIVESGGNYVASGYINSSGTEDEHVDGVIVTYNEKGDRLNQKIFATDADDFGRKIIPTADGAYIFLMTKIIQSTRGIRILKLDAGLNTLWEKEIIKPGKANTAPVGIKLNDGRIVIGCFGEASSNTLNGMDASLIFLDKNGNF